MRLFKPALVLSAFILLSGCTAVAELAGYDSRTINAEAAKAYTATIHSARRQGTVETNTPTARRVHQVFERMLPYAEAENRTGVPFVWEMHVIRDSERNAFAMPGGKMVVQTGIVEQLSLNDDEIAAVVGHEMTHALLEHFKAEYGQKILTGLGIMVGGKVLESQTGLSPDAIGIGTGLIGELGVTKPFSRTQEYEADRGGMMLMAKAGYHPQAAISLWQKMSNAADGSLPLEMLSTHPAHAGRIQALQENMPEAMQYYQSYQSNMRLAAAQTTPSKASGGKRNKTKRSKKPRR